MATGDQGTPVLTTHDLYPSMMQGTKLLILDYDVTRYHSFDFFSYLLTIKENFMSCDPRFLCGFLKATTKEEKVLYYMRECPYFNPYDNFTNLRDKISRSDMEANLNGCLADLKVTPTDLDERLEVFFQKQSVSGYLLKYTKDPHLPSYSDRLTVYTSDNILDLRMATAIIEKHNINAVMISSVDLAILLAERMLKYNIQRPVSFIIGAYLYNYDSENRVMRQLNMMNRLEYSQKHEFGIFDPYTGLNFMRKADD